MAKIQICKRQITKQPNSPKTHENDQKFFFLELVKGFFSKRVICVKNGTFENAKVHLLPIVEHQKYGYENSHFHFENGDFFRAS